MEIVLVYLIKKKKKKKKTYLACYRALIHGWLVFDVVTANKTIL